MPHKNKIFQKNSDGTVSCLLCPHKCSLQENETGRCLIRKAYHEKVVLTGYGKISVLSIEPIKKKPFLHFLKNTNTLSVGGCGCNLSCQFCENHLISQSLDFKAEYSPHEIVALAIDNRCNSVCMTYNEPIIYFEYLLDLAKESHKFSLPFLLKTNAYVNAEPWKEICELTDAMNIDWKGSKSSFLSITQSYSYVLMDRIKEAYEYGVHLEISIPLFYPLSDIDNEINYVGKFISSLDKNIPCHILTICPSFFYYPSYFYDDNKIEEVIDILSKYMTNIYKYI